GVMEVGEVEPGRISVVTELVEGRRLSEILAAGKPLDFDARRQGGVLLGGRRGRSRAGGKPLDFDAARQWVLDLGGAIEMLHNLGLLHGAIRPRNVMLLADGRVKLMDIELAGLRDTPTLRDDKAPAEYLAPEQTDNAPWTEKTDTYAFGVLVYDVFCGGPPLQASTREAVLAKQLNDTPGHVRRRRALPASMESIVAQALEKDPELRPWMHEMLNGLWGETGVSAPANRARSGSLGWKGPAVFAGSAVAAAAAIVLAIWGLSGLWSSSEPPVASAPAEQAPVRPHPPSAGAVTRPEPAVRPGAPAAAPQAVAPPMAPMGAPAPAAHAARRARPRGPGAPRGPPPPPAPRAPVIAAPPPAKPTTPNVPAADTRATTPP